MGVFDALLLLISLSAATNAATFNISLSPSWINYGENATVTFSFSPPCQGMSIYRNSSPSSCFIGASCLNNPLNGLVEIDPSDQAIRFKEQTFKINDFYWGMCHIPRPIIYNQFPSNSSPSYNLKIGVNPRIIGIKVDPPRFQPIVLQRTIVDSGNRLFKVNKTIELQDGDSQIIIDVGRGFSPNAPKTGDDFSFTVPEFSENGDFPFVKVDAFGRSTFGIPDYPQGFRYRYHFTRNSLVKNGICSIKGTASATLAKTQKDEVPFEAHFSFDPLISEITMFKVNDTFSYPYAKKDDCVFVCRAAVCPLHNLQYEWSFYSTLTPSYVASNVPNDPHLFVLNSTDCQSLYTKVIRQRYQYHVACRVKSPNTGVTKDSVVSFFTLVDPHLSTTTQRPTTQSYRQEAQKKDDGLEDWKIALIVIAVVVFLGFVIILIILIVKARRRNDQKKPIKQPPGRMAVPPPNGRPGMKPNTVSQFQQPPQQVNGNGFNTFQPAKASTQGAYASQTGTLPSQNSGRSPGTLEAPAPLYMSNGAGSYDQGDSNGNKMGYVNLNQQPQQSQQAPVLYDNPNHGQIYTEIAVNNTPRSRAPIQTTYAQLEQPAPSMFANSGGSNPHLYNGQSTQYSHPIFDRTVS